MERSSWSPVPLGPVVAGLLDGSLERLTPKVGQVAGAGFLFYPGKVNSLFGESGCGKTWTALVVAAMVLRSGGAVVYVDLEDDAAGVVGRLLDLGKE